MSGKLIGIGTGPGDPELLTVKAARLLRRTAVVAYVALPGVAGFARRIVAEYLPPTVRYIRIDVTMTTEREPAQSAYDDGATRIAEVLSNGQDVVCLCEGDALFYGSFMYLAARLSKEFRVETIPGVTSLSAASASALLPLAARNDVMTVLPATLSDADLSRRFSEADTIVIMKLGRHLPRIRSLLAGLNLEAIYIERASLPEERVMPLSDAPDDAPYFSMALIVKGRDPWLNR